MKVLPALLSAITFCSPILLFPQTITSATGSVTFRDVAGVIPAGCEWCHRGDARKSGYFMGSYGGLMDGPFRNGSFRPAIIPGDAGHSPFIEYIEGRRNPPMPYGRAPLPTQTIQRIRHWIDDGAKPDEWTSQEHLLVMDGVPITTGGRSFWLSCRAPRDFQNIGLRVKVIDEATGKPIAYEWPLDDSKDLNGRWNQWKIEIPEKSMQLPGYVTVVLYVSNGWLATQKGWDQDERELNGVIFLLEPKRTPDEELRKQKDLRTLPQPENPPHQTIRFQYVLRAPSDLTLSVKPQGGGPSLFQWSDKDLPPGKVLETAWNIGSAPGPKTGWYFARMRCTSRDPVVFQPDLAILFHIVR